MMMMMGQLKKEKTLVGGGKVAWRSKVPFDDVLRKYYSECE